MHRNAVLTAPPRTHTPSTAGTVPPAPERTIRPPAELRTRAPRFDGDRASRRMLLDLVDGEIEARRSAAEVTSSLSLFAVTR
jgi:hypothetical protein